MTVAAMHTVALGEQLQQASARAERRFRKTAARIVSNPWMITTGEDLRFPKAEGPRPFHLPVIQGYLAQVLEVAHTNPTVARQFFDVMTFMRQPPALFHPSVSAPVVRHLIGKLFQVKEPQQTAQEFRPTVQPNR